MQITFAKIIAESIGCGCGYLIHKFGSNITGMKCQYTNYI
jgi:hypothetical protein